MLDTRKLEKYLVLTSTLSKISLLPADARNVRITNIKKMSGGVLNKTWSFQLTFERENTDINFELVLKTYTGKVGLWSRSYRSDEDPRQYVREFSVLRGLKGTGYHVPEAYVCECDPYFLGYPFVIMKKEEALPGGMKEIDCFASALARLHSLKLNELKIASLKVPQDNFAFASARTNCLNNYLNVTRHYRYLKKEFDRAMQWLGSNTPRNACPKYCLIHGEYHPGHTLLTGSNLTVIDWENAAIGDPAFDVAYAYHMVKLINDAENPHSGEKAASQFLSAYKRYSDSEFTQRLEFYKVIAILGVAVAVSSWISTPIKAYRLFGHKAFARALAFPVLRSELLFKRWLNDDFFISCLKYCQTFLESNLR